MESMCAQTWPRWSHPKEILGNGVKTHINPKGKIPSTGKKFSSEEDQTQDAASSIRASPTHYQLSYSGPHQAGQPAQHTTNQLFRPPSTASSRTASPTHYQLSYPGPHQAGQPAQHTTNELLRSHGRHPKSNSSHRREPLPPSLPLPSPYRLPLNIYSLTKRLQGFRRPSQVNTLKCVNCLYSEHRR